ncbi:MAG: hypothetical protein IPK62_05980 [Bacteroidetes bacterium]|nr:hypothetical protein [Bacteroidota bacterium]
MTATIPGANLVVGKNYAVQFDSTCFKSGVYSSLGIYNNTLWNFFNIAWGESSCYVS